MKTSFFTKALFAIVFLLLLFPLKTFGETSPFKVNTTLLKDHVSASDLIPVTVSISIAPNHHIYKDQFKVESGVSGQFTIASIALPAGKISLTSSWKKKSSFTKGNFKRNYSFRHQRHPGRSTPHKTQGALSGLFGQNLFCPKNGGVYVARAGRIIHLECASIARRRKSRFSKS